MELYRNQLIKDIRNSDKVTQGFVFHLFLYLHYRDDLISEIQI